MGGRLGEGKTMGGPGEGYCAHCRNQDNFIFNSCVTGSRLCVQTTSTELDGSGCGGGQSNPASVIICILYWSLVWDTGEPQAQPVEPSDTLHFRDFVSFFCLPSTAYFTHCYVLYENLKLETTNQIRHWTRRKVT